MLTPTQRHALEILRDHAPLSPSVFARWMWPKAEAWSHHTKCGHGTSHGGGMNLAGGGYLGKLRKRGWAERWYEGFISKPPGWYLSDEGKAALDTGAPQETGGAAEKCAICGHHRALHVKLQCLTNEQGVIYWQMGGCWECPCPEFHPKAELDS